MARIRTSRRRRRGSRWVITVILLLLAALMMYRVLRAAEPDAAPTVEQLREERMAAEAAGG
jgi:hypothetical protein